ncbi:tyramine/octopamine receptor-like isoform X2 [Ornithodoros turicata]|uniref:tyramine/octopamine receptor-like isoform X2 n=1 Tax=Ornithodoros turicata TaxID=34597 RepID=UPI003138F0F1
MESGDPPPPWVLTAPGLTLTTTLGLVILITVIGNTLVVAAVATTRRLRTVTNFFVVSLAVSDLLVGFLVMPLAVMKEVIGEWLFGRIVCDLWVSLDVMLCTASILNLCCISLDRYFAITHPLAYAVKRSGRLALLMVAVAWILSAAITCPPMFGWREDSRQNSTDCSYNMNQGYVIYSACGSFFIPATIMVYVYWRIFAVARKRETVLLQESSRRDNPSEPEECDDGGTVKDSSLSVSLGPTAPPLTAGSSQRQAVIALSTGTEKAAPINSVFRNSNKLHQASIVVSDPLPSCPARLPARAASPPEWNSTNSSKGKPLRRTKSMRLSRFSGNTMSQKAQHWRRREGYERAAFQRERRVAKSLALVVGGFVICWLPFFTAYVIEPFCDACSLPTVASSCLVWLGWINSTINPLIYALNNSDFREAFLRLTINKCRRNGHRRAQDPRNYF